VARAQSPGYPNMSLPKALAAVKKIHDADRRNPIDRLVAAKHIGYGGLSGASDKAIASLAHFGLIEKTGKGEIRISSLAVDILHPNSVEDRRKALLDAAFSPQIFADLRERFGEHVSEGALESYLKRENFLDRAIGPVVQSYLETCRYLEQEKAFESGGAKPFEASESLTKDGDVSAVFGGAKVGDLVQWEINGTLQMERPMRVRLVSEDGQWVAVDGSETGIPMNQVLVEESAAALPKAPPRFAVELSPAESVGVGETEWMRSQLSRDTKVRLLVSGEMSAKEIGKLIKLLKVQQSVLSDDDEDEDEKEE
jgi:hypothetical protein